MSPYGSLNPLMGGGAAMAAASMPGMGYGGMGMGMGMPGSASMDAAYTGRMANQAAHAHVASCPLGHSGFM